MFRPPSLYRTVSLEAAASVVFVSMVWRPGVRSRHFLVSELHDDLRALTSCQGIQLLHQSEPKAKKIVWPQSSRPKKIVWPRVDHPLFELLIKGLLPDRPVFVLLASIIALCIVTCALSVLSSWNGELIKLCSRTIYSV